MADQSPAMAKTINTSECRPSCLVIVAACVLLLLVAFFYAKFTYYDIHFGSKADFASKYLDGDFTLAEELETIRVRHRTPALCAAIVDKDGIVKIGCAGLRKLGHKIPATIQDEWHLGSCGKLFTADLICRLVSEGRLDLKSNVAGIFPELSSTMSDEFKRVTLEQLLAHTSGLERDVDYWAYQSRNEMASKADLRYSVLRDVCRGKLRFGPGMDFSYSNVGYLVLGAVVDRVSGQSWEDSMRAEIFRPLRLDTAGFGGMGTSGKIDQPWQHSVVTLGALTLSFSVNTNGPDSDYLPLFVAPAGLIHCSMVDWAKVVSDQIRGSRGEDGILPARLYKEMQRPSFISSHSGAFKGSGLGWMMVNQDWSRQDVLFYIGSNSQNSSSVCLDVAKGIAYLACSNEGGAEDADNDAINYLIGNK